MLRLSPATASPAAISALRRSWVDVAGPSVQTILARRLMTHPSSGLYHFSGRVTAGDRRHRRFTHLSRVVCMRREGGASAAGGPWTRWPPGAAGGGGGGGGGAR